MASAIHETAGSLRDRAAVEAQIRAENDALAHEHVRLKKLGLLTDLIPLDQIDAAKLTRDRALGEDAELVELIASVRDIGLSNPIRVEAQTDGRYELVQGFRRLAAFRALLEETGDAERFGRIPATIMARGETLERLYRQMVDENLVRKDISYAEMAQMAIHYAAEPDIAEPDPAEVVARLFGSASYSKRSHIRSFVRLIAALGPDLQHAAAMPRNLGLALAARIEADEGMARQIREALQASGAQSAGSEQYVLQQFVRNDPPQSDLGVAAFPVAGIPAPPPRPDGAKDRAATPAADPARLTFQLPTPQGLAHCIVVAGRIELRLNCDFRLIERARLEAAVQALLDRLA